MSQQVYSIELFNNKALVAGGSAVSAIIDVNSMRPLGQFASQLKIVGDGSVTVKIFTSINGVDFILYDTLFDAYTAGEYLESHGFAVAKKFYIQIEEVGGNYSATVSQWLGVQ